MNFQFRDLKEHYEVVFIIGGILGFIVFLLIALLSNFTSDSTNAQYFAVGTTFLFISVTAIYAQTTRNTLKEAENSRRNTEIALRQADIERLDQKRPVLSLRWRWFEETNQAGKKQFGLSTRILNVGSGPALKIRLYSNLDNPNDVFSATRFHISLQLWKHNNFVFGKPLGPDSGDPDLHIAFCSSELRDKREDCYSPLLDDKVIIFADYEDIFGRNFVTIQTVNEVICRMVTNSERDKLFFCYSSKAQKISDDYQDHSLIPTIQQLMECRDQAINEEYSDDYTRRIRNRRAIAMSNQIILFTDSVKLPTNSGHIKAGVLIPEELYISDYQEHCREILSRIKGTSREFKGSKLSSKNIDNYAEFLKATVNSICFLSDASDLRSVVSLNGNGINEQPPVKNLENQIKALFNGFGVHDCDLLIGDFARQIIWLLGIADHMFPTKYDVKLSVIIDEEHSFANLVDEQKKLYSKYGRYVDWPIKRIMQVAFNTIRRDLNGFRNVPEVNVLDYADSKNEFGIQAADLLANVFNGAIRYELGDTSKSAQIRRELLKRFMPGFSLDSRVQSHCRLVDTNPGEKGIQITSTNLKSQFELEPDE